MPLLLTQILKIYKQNNDLQCINGSSWQRSMQIQIDIAVKRKCKKSCDLHPGSVNHLKWLSQFNFTIRFPFLFFLLHLISSSIGLIAQIPPQKLYKCLFTMKNKSGPLTITLQAVSNQMEHLLRIFL